ncbi:hypothetical protein [Azoarcus sp. KH32C]|uniref:hypothetical protein n=1 Tax=Azoarcus sp. KH32C TaxID=748247 RepID=UPI0002385CBA|nr:hypothetical protein [Azoarcus sp. KH32C]BAL27465.1 hypothetical protein AZKH_p0582 [Azoarcus sp. KH32C]
MKHAFHPVAAAFLMCAGIGSGCAEEAAGGQRASDPDHYAYIDAFYSGPENYPISW